MTTNLLLNLHRLPNSLPSEGSIGIELVKGVLVFRISTKIQEPIETLTAQKTESALTSEEARELDQYQQLVDYLNLVNETIKKAFCILYTVESSAMMSPLNLLHRQKMGKCCNDCTGDSYMGVVG
jgi:hypothetical protein